MYQNWRSSEVRKFRSSVKCKEVQKYGSSEVQSNVKKFRSTEVQSQVSEVNQPFAGAALVAVRNQWSDDLVDIIVDNVGCGRPQGPPLQGITALPKLEFIMIPRQ